MATNLLLMFPREAGSKLIDALDKVKFPIKAAMWLYKPETDDWQLIIATPLVEQKGPREAYQQILSLLEAFEPPLGISLSDVTVVNPNSNLIRSLREVAHVDVGEKGILLRWNALQGVPAEEVYIYRML